MIRTFSLTALAMIAFAANIVSPFPARARRRGAAGQELSMAYPEFLLS